MDSQFKIGSIVMIAVFMFVYLPLIAIMIVSWWKIFTKAGQAGWKSLIPIYNNYIFLKIVQKPGWWLIMLFIPPVSIYFGVIALLHFARVFGKSCWFALGFVFLPFVFYPILAFGKSEYNPENKMRDAKPVAILLAIIFTLYLLIMVLYCVGMIFLANKVKNDAAKIEISQVCQIELPSDVNFSNADVNRNYPSRIWEYKGITTEAGMQEISEEIRSSALYGSNKIFYTARMVVEPIWGDTPDGYYFLKKTTNYVYKADVNTNNLEFSVFKERKTGK